MARLAVDVPARVPYGYVDREPWLELDFPVKEFRRRETAIQEALEEAELEALLMYGDQYLESNVRYVSGLLRTIRPVMGDRSAIAPTDSCHQRRSARGADALRHPDHIPGRHSRRSAPASTGTRMTPVDFAIDAIDEFAPTGSVGLADANIPAPAYLELQEKFGSRLVDAPQILRRARRIKSPAEIQVIRKLAAAATACMEAALDAVAPGVTENEIAAAGHQAAVAAGADRVVCLLVAAPAQLHEERAPARGKAGRTGRSSRST